MRLKKQWKVLLPQTRVCKICFQDIYVDNFLDFTKKHEICRKCRKNIHEKWIKFKVENVQGYAIYEYKENIQSLLYQYKGCYDYELKNVFLDKYNLLISLLYHGYHLVCIPSNKEDDEVRGFNHVAEMFSLVKLKKLDVFYKLYKYKQSDRNSEQRKEIEKCLKVKDNIDLTNKKILLVDDVMTTGSTISAAVKLLKERNVKKIKILVMSKVLLEDFENI